MVVAWIRLAVLVLLVCGTGHASGVERHAGARVEVAEGMVWRTATDRDPRDEFVPPVTSVKIVNVFGFKHRPPVGAYVAVIPLDVTIAPIELRVIKSLEGETAGCGEQATRIIEIELEPVRDRRFFTAAAHNRRDEAPFDVALVYPAAKHARQVPNARLTRAMLPKDVAASNVWAAIDTTGGQRPDIVIVKYCCLDVTKRPEECDLTCGKTYLKTTNVWTLVGTSAPC